MEKIAIIGAGVIGMTLANYLDTNKFDITVFDDSLGQATKASAGIISPWLSKRRNKQWYQLAKDGAAFFSKLQQDFALSSSVYKQSGTLIIRKEKQLDALYDLALNRKKGAPEIGDIKRLSSLETTRYLPLLTPSKALFISGGGRLDGRNYLNDLKKKAQKKGVHFIHETASLSFKKDNFMVHYNQKESSFDRLALTCGPHLGELLKPLQFKVDIRPQKGQLLVFETNYQKSGQWPVAMLDGEADLTPFENGKIILGATHENEAKWDLSPTHEALEKLWASSDPFLRDSKDLFSSNIHFRVGTRAYSSDFAPFFGPIPGLDNLVVASGLGSSGLTTGPYIGYLLAQYLNQKARLSPIYQKPIETYLKKI
ncbi:MAG TPA: FAD-binding oxidoreductase [Candidatus Tetragenococcus pullicola]|nr:FAD-binding oxidoreductase [Candidatus Tetragenococcus pullicola]